MTLSRPITDRPITKADIKAKFSQLDEITTTGTEAAKGVGVAVVVVAVTVVVVGAFLLGRRRGKKRRTVLEIRRI
jgi:hypothetical protein